MSSETLENIKIEVEAPEHEYNSGNLHSILTEIKFSLVQLLEHKKTHCIDLRAMPWSPGEEEILEKYLGKGEVSIELTALGKSIFYETNFNGIWIVTHYNHEDEVMGKLIEISYMPEMIFSQYDDVKDSLERLQHLS